MFLLPIPHIMLKLILINEKDEQPHEFKRRTIDLLKLDYYVEDNWDVVNYLSQYKKTSIYWIYNIFDRQRNYNDKFPDLKRALQRIINNEGPI